MNQPVTLEVIAKDDFPLLFQWFKDGIEVPGAIYNELIIQQTRFADGGKYSVVVSNGSESLRSPDVQLNVRPAKGGDFDYSFRSGRSINGWVVSLVVQSDHKVLIAGRFNRVYGARREGIARLNGDGTLDSSFNPGRVTGGGIVKIGLQMDGKILVAGSFTNIAGFALGGLARLNPDGSVDRTFEQPLIEAIGSISIMQLQQDGKILIGGSNLSKVNGRNRRFLARLNADGTLDNSFFDTAAASVGPLLQIIPAASGKVLIVQQYQDIYHIDHTSLARLNLNGGLDTSFRTNDVPNTPVVVQPDGKIIAGGVFLQSGTQRFFLKRFKTDGTPDSSFAFPSFEVKPIPLIPSFVGVQSDGSILVAGSRIGVRKYNSDGSLVADFSSDADIRYQPPSALLDSDDKLVMVGVCDSTTSTVDSSGLVIRLNPNGSLDEGFQRPFSGLTRDGVQNAIAAKVQVQTDGKILVAGDFREIDGMLRGGVARLNQDGSLDTGFKAAIPVVEGRSLRIQENGKILFGHSLGLSRLNSDGSLDPDFHAPTFVSFQYSVLLNDIVVQNNGQILIAGRFNSINGSGRSCIARLNVDGSLDSAFNLIGLGDVFYQPEYPDYPHANSLLVQEDRKIIVVGYFTTVNRIPRNGIARLNPDGTLDAEFQPWPDIRSLNSVAVQERSKLLIAGAFSSINGVPARFFARLNMDGTLDTNFLGTVNDGVGVIHAQSDGRVLIGGSFTTVNGTARTELARLERDGSLDANFMAENSTSSGGVGTLAMQRDGKIVIGGPFNRVRGLPAGGAMGIARVWGRDFPARLTIDDSNQEKVSLSWEPTFAERYQLEFKNEPTEPNWISLGEQAAPFQIQTKSESKQQFFRLRLLP